MQGAFYRKGARAQSFANAFSHPPHRLRIGACAIALAHAVGRDKARQA
jgi:hypothetical protein